MANSARPSMTGRMAKWLKKTPIHPQWLMPERRVDAQLQRCQGVVLDIGAADGWLEEFLHLEAHYVTVDYPTTATGLYGTRPMVFADACRLPFADGSAEAVACYEVAEHVRQPEALFGEIQRVLRSGGFAEFTTPFLYPIHDAPFDFQRWTEHGWQRSMEDAGLEIVTIEPRGTAIECAATLACLSLAGPLANSRGPKVWLLLPLAALIIALINLSAFLFSLFWPAWPAMTVGYRLLVRKQNPTNLT